MIRRPWTTSELRTLRAMAGCNAVQIATHIDRTPEAIAEMARRHRIELSRRPGNALHDGSRRRARLMRTLGVPVREIARRMGVSRSAVSNWTREAAQA